VDSHPKSFDSVREVVSFSSVSLFSSFWCLLCYDLGWRLMNQWLRLCLRCLGLTLVRLMSRLYRIRFRYLRKCICPQWIYFSSPRVLGRWDRLTLPVSLMQWKIDLVSSYGTSINIWDDSAPTNLALTKPRQTITRYMSIVQPPLESHYKVAFPSKQSLLNSSNLTVLSSLLASSPAKTSR
jgi:hypothetical protein